MLFIYGKRTAKVKTFTDHSQHCRSCTNLGHTVIVYHQYFHIFFIPVAPSGEKIAKMYCASCRVPFRHYEIETGYEKVIKSPFYLYLIPLMFGALILFIIIAVVLGG